METSKKRSLSYVTSYLLMAAISFLGFTYKAYFESESFQVGAVIAFGLLLIFAVPIGYVSEITGQRMAAHILRGKPDYPEDPGRQERLGSLLGLLVALPAWMVVFYFAMSITGGWKAALWLFKSLEQVFS